jgi:glycosyltransferase involved in cell wall biosynthesis
VEIPLTAHSRERKPIITCVSRLVGYKRIGDLLRAVAVLVKEFPDLQCNIIGTGPEEENLRAMATRLEITQYVSFSGFVKNHDDLMQTISESRLFCLPGSLEGFGIAVLEAMACGVPFVASHIPAIAETTAGKGGLLFECGNVPDMTDKIRILLKDNLLLDRLSEEGLKRAGEFLWKDIAKKTEAIYEKAVAAK